MKRGERRNNVCLFGKYINWATDFYEGGLTWNDPEIGIEWPKLVWEYNGTASAEGYALEWRIRLSSKKFNKKIKLGE